MSLQPSALIGVVAAIAGGCNPWIDDVVVKVRDPSLVSVRPPQADPRKGELPVGRSQTTMKVIDADVASLWLRRLPDGSIVALPTDHPGAQGPDTGTRLSSSGELVLPRQSELPFRITDARKRSAHELVSFPSRLVNQVATDLKIDSTTTNNVTTTTIRTTYAIGSDVAIFQSPVENVEDAWHRRRGNKGRGWGWLAVGVTFDALALWVLQKGERQLGPGDKTPLYAFVGGMAAFSIPATGYGSYILLSPETRTPLY